MLILKMNTKNAAFDENPYGEVARILRQAADHIAKGNRDVPLYDVNGNRVGTAQLVLTAPG